MGGDYRLHRVAGCLKANTGGGWRDVYVVHSLEELWHSHDQTDTRTMILQEFIAWDDWGHTDPPRTAIVDWPGLPTLTEFEMFQRFFAPRGSSAASATRPR